MTSAPPVTRLAPSPTGHLHLGNAWSFLIAWLAARSAGGKVYLRMDDIDPARSRRDYGDAILRDLEWLGLDWDSWQGQDIVWQSARTGAYENVLARLCGSGLVYPCFCSRREIRMLANAPHPGDEGAPYFGKCRLLSEAELAGRAGRPHSLRLATPELNVEFRDLIQGRQDFSRSAWGGDFALRRPDGVWAYQLASVVDDAEMGVNLVVRGRDLLASTARQILLGNALGYSMPAYAHLPLLLDGTGQRLAKRRQGLALGSLRDIGWSGEAVIGLLAFLGGLRPDSSPLPAQTLLPFFRLELIRPDDIFLPPDLDLQEEAKGNGMQGH